MSIRVRANGDIIDRQSARDALDDSCADGLMVGRGAQGKPWVIAQIQAGLAGQPMPQTPDGDDLVDLVLEHYEAMLDFYGLDLGLRIARKHLSWYMDAANTDQALRKKVLTSETPTEVSALMPQALMTKDHAA